MFNRLFSLGNLILFVTLLSFVACETLDTNELQNYVTEQVGDRFGGVDRGGNNDDNDRRGHGRCFELVFPVTVVLPDGTTADATEKEDMRTIFKDWKTANPESTERPTLQFPVEVVKDDETISIADEAAFEALREECPGRGLGHHGGRGHGHHGGAIFRPNPCFEVVFPLTVAFPDGTTATTDDREAMRAAIHTWIEANSESLDSLTRPEVVFPIEVILAEDTSTVAVASSDELKTLAEACFENFEGEFGRGGRGHGHDRDGGRFGHYSTCFTAVFPLTVVFPDETTAEAADKDAIKELFKAWRTENRGSRERPTIAFPYDVVYEDGTTVTVESREQMKELKEACGE